MAHLCRTGSCGSERNRTGIQKTAQLRRFGSRAVFGYVLDVGGLGGRQL